MVGRFKMEEVNTFSLCHKEKGRAFGSKPIKAGVEMVKGLPSQLVISGEKKKLKITVASLAIINYVSIQNYFRSNLEAQVCKTLVVIEYRVQLQH